MNKEEIQKELQETEARLAELRAKMDEPEHRLPQNWEVWDVDNHEGSPTLFLPGHSFIHLNKSISPELGSYEKCHEHFVKCRNAKYLGTFKEVFVRRDKLEEIVRKAFEKYHTEASNKNDFRLAKELAIAFNL